MEYTAEDRERIKRQFARMVANRRRLTTRAALVVVLAVVTQHRLGTVGAGGAAWLGTATMAALLVVLIIMIVRSHNRWRCPGCGRKLPRLKSPVLCPHCSAVLR